MNFDKHINCLFNSVSYCVGKSVVDAGDEWDGFRDAEAVLLTHAHFDHIYGLSRLLEINPLIRIYTNQYGREMLLDSKKNLSRYHEMPFQLDSDENIVVVDDGDVIDIGEGLSAKAVFTPGHNASCVTWIIGDLVFSGDSLIPGIKTVTNLPGSDKVAAKESEKLILLLSIGKKILPGHDIGDM